MNAKLKLALKVVENASEFKREELLNALTEIVTGQGDWETFKTNMKEGYVPTIRTRRPTKRMGRQQATWVQAEQMLAQMIREEGFRVFDGSRVY